MTPRRKFLFILLIIPVAMIIVLMAWPGTGLELVFLLIGMPILVLNVWEYTSPETMDSYFGKSKSTTNEAVVNPEGNFMKNKSFLALIILIPVLILLVVGYAAIRSYLDRVSFLFALSIFLIKLASKLWHFLATPIVFIALLVFLLLWLFRTPISMAIKKRKGFDAAKFPDVFNQTIHPPVQENNPPSNTKKTAKSNASETGQSISWLMEHGIDAKAIQLLLDIDGQDITKLSLLSRIGELGINSAGLPPMANETQKEAFYRGVYEALYSYVFPIFCSIEIKNDAGTACFALKPGVRERFSERLDQRNDPSGSFAI